MTLGRFAFAVLDPAFPYNRPPALAFFLHRLGDACHHPTMLTETHRETIGNVTVIHSARIEPVRRNGVCKVCGAKHSHLITGEARGVVGRARVWQYITTETLALRVESADFLFACSCGGSYRTRAVVGKCNPAKVCNAKCLASIGGVCECSCGGRNHGASHAA